jgi:hypothetical protein
MTHTENKLIAHVKAWAQLIVWGGCLAVPKTPVTDNPRRFFVPVGKTKRYGSKKQRTSQTD